MSAAAALGDQEIVRDRCIAHHRSAPNYARHSDGANAWFQRRRATALKPVRLPTPLHPVVEPRRDNQRAEHRAYPIAIGSTWILPRMSRRQYPPAGG
jgi:hypothetical protein